LNGKLRFQPLYRLREPEVKNDRRVRTGTRTQRSDSLQSLRTALSMPPNGAATITVRRYRKSRPLAHIGLHRAIPRPSPIGQSTRNTEECPCGEPHRPPSRSARCTRTRRKASAFGRTGGSNTSALWLECIPVVDGISISRNRLANL
jgi:hypothetical protein